MAAVGVQMLLPALWQELIEVGMRMDARMHVAIDDAQAAFRGDFLVQNRAVDDVAHAILLDGMNSGRELQPRKGFKRIVGAHARDETGRQMRRHRIVAVELPVRVVGREQEHLVGADLLDDVGDPSRIGRARRTAAW